MGVASTLRQNQRQAAEGNQLLLAFMEEARVTSEGLRQRCQTTEWMEAR
jgi:hypothetical protein